jgi:hypothetical protein
VAPLLSHLLRYVTSKVTPNFFSSVSAAAAAAMHSSKRNEIDDNTLFFSIIKSPPLAKLSFLLNPFSYLEPQIVRILG